MWPVPNSLPETVVPPRKCSLCSARFTFENLVPPCSGAKPPRLYALMLVSPKRPPYRPYHGWKRSHGPRGSQPIEPQPPPKPNPPPYPKNETQPVAQTGRKNGAP